MSRMDTKRTATKKKKRFSERYNKGLIKIEQKNYVIHA